MHVIKTVINITCNLTSVNYLVPEVDLIELNQFELNSKTHCITIRDIITVYCEVVTECVNTLWVKYKYSEC